MLTFICLLCIVVLAGCAAANRFYTPPDLEIVDPIGTAGVSDAETLSITTWNIGYAGMGAESDFIYDLGEQRRPLSGDLVDKNLTGILNTLPDLQSDLFLFQEAAKPSWLTYGRDVLTPLTEALPGYAHVFGADANARYVPPPFNIQVGNAIYSRVQPIGAERRALPLEPTFELGFFRKGYRMHIMRIDDVRQWVIINIHLSTFDTAEDDVRRKQVEALLAFATQEYAKGHHVVIGGDWNLRLVENDFPHTTDDQFQFWIRDFPTDLKPAGWNWAVDPDVPTVRTAHKPYVAGENYVLNIDGFLVSPNVRIDKVQGTDLQFQYTDHHPVTATFTALP